MKRSLAAGLASASALALALVLPARAADALVSDFKKAWAEASAMPEVEPTPEPLPKGQRPPEKREGGVESAVEKRGKAQLAALEKLTSATSLEAAQALVQVAIDPKAHWKAHALSVDLLGKMQDKAVREWALKAVASDPDVRVRCVLCTVVIAFNEELGVRALTFSLRDKNPLVVAAAAEALIKVKKKDVVEALVGAIKDAKDQRSIDNLCFTLRKLSGKNLTDPAEWSSWWDAEKSKFEFPDAPSNGGGEKPGDGGGSARPGDGGSETPAGEGGSSLPRTTSDGSGLYDKVTSEHVCFVIDNSGSMKITGEVLEDEKKNETTSKDPAKKKRTCSRLEYVQKELVAVIDAQLSKKASFNVVSFASNVVPWKKSLVAANDGNRKAAKDWVMGLRPTSETNIYEALETAFADKEVDTIYLLTDGFPDYGKFITTEGIVGEVKKWNMTRKVRIHCICYLVGDGKAFHVFENKALSKAFMSKLAEDSGGTFKCFE